MKIRFPDRKTQNQGTFWGLWVQIDMGDVLVLGFGRWTAHFSKAPSLAGGLSQPENFLTTKHCFCSERLKVFPTVCERGTGLDLLDCIDTNPNNP